MNRIIQEQKEQKIDHFNSGNQYLMPIKDDPYYSFKCACCSFAASYVVGVFHPLELLKTRLQSHDGRSQGNIVPKYGGIIKGLKDIKAKQGFRGLYKGIHFTMFSQAASGALFFWIYEQKKKNYEKEGENVLSATTYAGIQASILCTLTTQPLWVIKTRVLLNTQSSLGQFSITKLKISQIWKQSKFRGFYSGLSMNLILSLTGALQMYSYEGTKLLYQFLRIQGTGWGEKNFICGGFSKIFTTLITYPFTTIRTRIQQDQYFQNRIKAKYKNIWEITKKISLYQGISGFYKGLSPNLIRGIPQRGVYFYFYQLFKSWFIIPTDSIKQ